jgi:hypothetical protein
VRLRSSSKVFQNPVQNSSYRFWVLEALTLPIRANIRCGTRLTMPDCPIYALRTRHQLLYHQHCSTPPFSKMSHTQLASKESKALALSINVRSRDCTGVAANSHRKNNSTNSVKFGGPVLAPSTRGSSPGKSAHPSTRISCSPKEFFKSRTRTYTYSYVRTNRTSSELIRSVRVKFCVVSIRLDSFGVRIQVSFETKASSAFILFLTFGQLGET